MLNLPSNRVLALAVASIVILSLISPTVRVGAITTILDQQCSTVGGGTLNGIGAYEPAGQTFTPTQTSVVAFSINVYSSNGVDTPMTAKILAGGIGGAVQGSVDFSIPAAFGGPSGAWFTVQFTSGVPVTPGSSYALDLTDKLASSGIKWNDCTDSYPGGKAYSSGSYNVAGTSFAFMEYAGDFSIGLSVGTFSTPQGTPAAIVDTVTVTSLSNFNSPVTLSVAGAPAGVTTGFSISPITPPAGASSTSILSISIPGSVSAGVYTMTITGTSGPTSHSSMFDLTVTPPVATPDFSISSSLATIPVTQGGSNTATITVTSINGFSSAVDLSASWVGSAPTGVTFTLPTPITPPSGSTATSSLMITATGSASTGSFTLRVTGASGALSHDVVPDLAIQVTAVSTTTSATSSVATSDFSIAASPPSISITQGNSGTSTVSVGSMNGFSSSVDLAYSWLGSAPSGVSVALPGPVTPPSGSTATSTLTVMATPSASTGSFTLSITGTSGAVSHSTSVGVLISAAAATTSSTTSPVAPKCLIATATYGSELAPEVQLLRNFRDYSIMKTQSGSNFMVAFNAWYYSFSPYVAVYLTNHWVERTIMKGVLYPLIGILYLTSNLFSATSAYPELAALLSGLLASSLIGAFYLGLPLSVLRARFRRLRGLRTQHFIQKLLGISLLSGLIGLLLGEVLASSLVLMISSAIIVLSTLFLSAALTSAKVAKRLQTRI